MFETAQKSKVHDSHLLAPLQKGIRNAILSLEALSQLYMRWAIQPLEVISHIVLLIIGLAFLLVFRSDIVDCIRYWQRSINARNGAVGEQSTYAGQRWLV